MAEAGVTLNVGTGGASVAVFTDSGNKVYQEFILKTQTGAADPVGVTTATPLPVNVVLGGGTGGTSSSVGAAYPATATAIGAKDAGNLMQALKVDGSNNLYVNVAAGSLSALTDNSSAFTNATTQALGIAAAYNDSATSVTTGNMGIPRITAARQLRMVVDAASNGGWTPYSAIQPATVAKAVLKASAGQLGYLVIENLNAAAVYLRIWDNVTGSVTLGATASDLMFIVPGNTAGAGFALNLGAGISFATGIIIAVSGLIAATDNTAIAANSVVVNAGWK